MRRHTHIDTVREHFEPPPPPPDGALLMAILPKGVTPLSIMAELARDAYRVKQAPSATQRLSPEFTPAQAARLFGIKGPSMRRDLATMVDRGEAVRVRTGVYRLVETEGEEIEESEEESHGMTRAGRAAWERWVRDSAELAGWSQARCDGQADPMGKPRRIRFGSVPSIIRHSPRKRFPSGSTTTPVAGGGGSPRSGSGGRRLEMSWDSWLRHKIPVITTPLHSLEVIDDDRGGAVQLTDADAPEHAIGYSVTPKGRHWYRRAGWEGGIPEHAQDPNYRAYTDHRGRWVERLFSDDGAPRPAPRPLPGVADRDKGLVLFHARWWITYQRVAQQKALVNGYSPTPPRDPELSGEAAEMATAAALVAHGEAWALVDDDAARARRSAELARFARQTAAVVADDDAPETT